MPLRYRIGLRVAAVLIAAFLTAVLAAPSYGAMVGFLIIPALAVGRGVSRAQE